MRSDLSDNYQMAINFSKQKDNTSKQFQLKEE
jgi:hypothetical protein